MSAPARPRRQPLAARARHLLMALAVAVAVPLAACQTSQGDVGPAPGPFGGPRPLLDALVNPGVPLGLTLWSGMPEAPSIGTRLALLMRAAVPAYLSLYHVGATGRPSVLFENQAIDAGVAERFPAVDSPTDLVLAPPAGVESFVLVATTVPFAPGLPRAPGGGLATPLAVSTTEFANRVRATTARLPGAAWDVAVLHVRTHGAPNQAGDDETWGL